MKGAIYSQQKCPVCGELFRDNFRNGLSCPDHPDQYATRFIVKYGRKLLKRFRSYDEACEFLTGIRYKDKEGSFDIRDYRRDNPLGFENQARRYLAIKEKAVKPGSYRNIKREINRAIDEWGNRNIKAIGYAEIEDYLYGLDVSDKTRSNVRSVIHDFFSWVCHREDIPMPKMPKCDFELGWRNIVDLEIQDAIIEEVKRISYSKNPRIWIGIKWLATYIAIRPGEMVNLKEKHINVNGMLVIPHPKEKKPKLVPMLEEDIALYRSLPRGLPEMPFFRHNQRKGVIAGTQFGKHLFYDYWKQACNNLDIEGVDLYGGTRHSTTTAMAKHFTRDEVRSATKHGTNKAFDRYCQAQNDGLKVYEKIAQIKRDKVVECINGVSG